jgi:hypothetical protein
VQDVALIPGTAELLGAGLTHAYNNADADVLGAILAYES